MRGRPSPSVAAWRSASPAGPGLIADAERHEPLAGRARRS